ncbi:MAG: ABC transporter ATP-binding protein [Lachnospiraceae bacterium]|nr:ABC transporter ATP-binding protein [Lachnospiraceae bacterium]MDD3616038.1 ABC transporter ATP-binding protein [Lachnospiraceae bacterium]
MELIISNVMKNYGKKDVLKGVSFKMDNGIYGLLGPNGAGKTTLIRILAGLIPASSGQVLYNGKKCDKEYRAKLGYLPQDLDFYPNFTGRQYLEYVANLKGLSDVEADRKIKELAEQVDLTDDMERRCVNYSGGMKRRLGIAQALLNNPEILILDEPTAGLDPYERIKFRNIISVFSKDRAVLLSTHIVSDVDSVAKKIIMIKDGKVGSMEDGRAYMQRMNGKVWECSIAPDKLMGFQKNHVISNAVPNGDMIDIRVLSNSRPHEKAVNLEPNLEDAYLYEFNYKEAMA